MVEVVEIRIHEDVPCQAKRYLFEIRLVDKSKGTEVTRNGFEVYKWDKGIAGQYNRLAYAIKRIEQLLTERLCR